MCRATLLTRGRLAQLGEQQINLDLLFDRFKNFGTLYGNASNEKKKVILQQVIDKIVFYEDRVDIILSV